MSAAGKTNIESPLIDGSTIKKYPRRTIQKISIKKFNLSRKFPITSERIKADSLPFINEKACYAVDNRDQVIHIRRKIAYKHER